MTLTERVRAKAYEQGVRDAVRIVDECWQRGGATCLSYAGREIVARLLPGARP